MLRVKSDVTYCLLAVLHWAIKMYGILCTALSFLLQSMGFTFKGNKINFDDQIQHAAIQWKL